jgi:protein-S-isoprenylcysteine O-methyltransferase Ste14
LLLIHLINRESGFRKVEMNIYQKWQNKGSSKGLRFLALILGFLIFPIGIPAILVLLLPRVDALLGIGSFYAGNINIIIGIIAILLGGYLALWTISAQITLASGTPFPMLPTQKLLIIGPFTYCRNPMTLGTVMAYAGVAIWAGSYAALFAVLFFFLALVVWTMRRIRKTRPSFFPSNSRKLNQRNNLLPLGSP